MNSANLPLQELRDPQQLVRVRFLPVPLDRYHQYQHKRSASFLSASGSDIDLKSFAIPRGGTARLYYREAVKMVGNCLHLNAADKENLATALRRTDGRVSPTCKGSALHTVRTSLSFVGSGSFCCGSGSTSALRTLPVSGSLRKKLRSPPERRPESPEDCTDKSCHSRGGEKLLYAGTTKSLPRVNTDATYDLGRSDAVNSHDPHSASRGKRQQAGADYEQLSREEKEKLLERIQLQNVINTLANWDCLELLYKNSPKARTDAVLLRQVKGIRGARKEPRTNKPSRLLYRHRRANTAVTTKPRDRARTQRAKKDVRNEGTNRDDDDNKTDRRSLLSPARTPGLASFVRDEWNSRIVSKLIEMRKTNPATGDVVLAISPTCI